MAAGRRQGSAAGLPLRENGVKVRVKEVAVLLPEMTRFHSPYLRQTIPAEDCGAHQFVPSRNMVFQSTPSLRTPYPISSTSVRYWSGMATPLRLSSAPGVEGERERSVKEADEGDPRGEGGGKARDGRRAIGRSFLGVDEALSGFLYTMRE